MGAAAACQSPLCPFFQQIPTCNSNNGEVIKKSLCLEIVLKYLYH